MKPIFVLAQKCLKNIERVYKPMSKENSEFSVVPDNFWSGSFFNKLQSFKSRKQIKNIYVVDLSSIKSNRCKESGNGIKKT